MRALFTSIPAYGHLLPILPLAAAARRCGDEVVVSTSASLAGAVGDLPFLPAGPTLPEMMVENERRTGGGIPAGLADVGPVVEFFTGTRVDMTLPDALAVAREFRPDLLVAEIGDFVAPLVAAILGIPWVAHDITTVRHPALAEGFAAGLAKRLTERGLQPRPRLAVVDPWPRWLQPDGADAPDDVLPVRPEAYAPPAAADADWARPVFAGHEHLPRVLVTLGTVVADAALLEAVLQAVTSVDVTVVVTTAPGSDPQALEVDRTRVHPTGFVPIAWLLEGVSAVVCAGGAGTVLAALTHGIPLVVMPVLADQPLIAERVAATGAGRVAAGPHEVADALRAVLATPSHRTAAADAATRLAAIDPPDAVWRTLRARVDAG